MQLVYMLVNIYLFHSRPNQLDNLLNCIWKLKEAKAVKDQEKFDSMTTEELDRAAAEAKAAPKYFEDMKRALQKGELIYNATGVYVGEHLSISRPNHSINSVQESTLSDFYFSTKYRRAALADHIATFSGVDGTVLVMPPETRGSCKHPGESHGYMQPFHGAGSGEFPSNVPIGSIKALNCEAAHTALNDAIKDGNFTGAVLSRLYEAWKAGAPDSDQLIDYYKKNLNYMAVLYITCYLKAAAPLLTALERLVRQRSTCLLLIYINVSLLGRRISKSIHDALFLYVRYCLYSASRSAFP
jgi:hypothetical protein